MVFLYFNLNKFSQLPFIIVFFAQLNTLRICSKGQNQSERKENMHKNISSLFHLRENK